MSHNWHSGTPGIGEWNGPWRAMESEGEVTQDEWQAAWTSLDKFLSGIGRNGCGDDDDFFLRSTWFKEHRSQVLELVNPKALTTDLLQRLQQWLREGHPTWRIIIPLFLGETNVIVVYAGAVRGGPEFEADWPAGLQCARLAMLKLPLFKHCR